MQLSAAQKDAALRATAEKALANQAQMLDRRAEKITLLNEQIAALRGQLAELQGILDAAQAKDVITSYSIHYTKLYEAGNEQGL